jgi:hypothetical protein
MTRMHQLVRERNVYRWAGLLLSDLSGIHHDRLPEATTPRVH